MLRRARLALLGAAAALAGAVQAAAQDDAPLRLTAGRFTVVTFPGDERFARSLLQAALAQDSFPGFPRPQERVTLAIAPDASRFRAWIGPHVPEWGAAVAFPAQRLIVMQGRRSGSDAGDPREVLRHELAHLAMHEFMRDLVPRWFDEGYAAFAAGERAREDFLATNFALALRGVPSLDELDEWFAAGEGRAQAAYALSYRAVADLAVLDQRRGLTLLFVEWRARQSLDRALRASHGLTLGGFERQWARRTRLRYGMLALFADVAVGSVVLLAVVLPLYVSRRRRDRRRLDAMRAADQAAEQAARESGLDALLNPEGPPEVYPPERDPDAPGPSPDRTDTRAHGVGLPAAAETGPAAGGPDPPGGRSHA